VRPGLIVIPPTAIDNLFRLRQTQKQFFMEALLLPLASAFKIKKPSIFTEGFLDDDLRE
jgi:hypothetical protein